MVFQTVLLLVWTWPELGPTSHLTGAAASPVWRRPYPSREAMSASSAIARLREAFDQDHALALLRRAIATPSVTGGEGAFAAMLKDELVSIGAEGVVLREFARGRPNVWGLRRGRPGADTLLLAGHTDTVHVRGWRERWAGTEREDPFGGALVDGAVWGRGASDLKAGLCATIEAVRTLDRAGVPLEPDSPHRLRRRRGERRAWNGRQRRSAGLRGGHRRRRSAEARHGDLCRADHARRVRRAHGLFPLRHQGHRQVRLFRDAGARRRRAESRALRARARSGAIPMR